MEWARSNVGFVGAEAAAANSSKPPNGTCPRQRPRRTQLKKIFAAQKRGWRLLDKSWTNSQRGLLRYAVFSARS